MADEEDLEDARDVDDAVYDHEDDEPESDSEEIKIENVGEISYAVIDVPKKGGGVLVLKGDNGTGKSTAIGIINALFTKSGRLKPRDLADRGTVEGFDRKINVAGTTTRSGDGEIATLDPSKFDFGDLVDPPYKEPEARNTRRIQALIGLSMVKPKTELFVEAVGGPEEYDRLLTPKDRAIQDPVILASKIKDAIEAQARDLETLNKNHVVNKQAAEAAAKGVDVKQPHDATKLQDELVDAANAFTRLEEKRNSYEAAIEVAKTAQLKIDAFRAERNEKDKALAEAVRIATETATGYATEMADLDSSIKDLEDRIVMLKRSRESLVIRKDSADQKLGDVTERVAERTREAEALIVWQQQITAGKEIVNPSDDEINAESLAVIEARNAVERGSTIRTAIAKTEEAKKITLAIKKNTKLADALRDKAANVFIALSKMIPKGPLYVVGGQFVIDTAKRPAEPYERLSAGERWKIGLPYAIEAVGNGGYVVAPQECWDSISETHRPEIATACEKAGVWLITAEVSTGELRSEIYRQPTD